MTGAAVALALAAAACGGPSAGQPSPVPATTLAISTAAPAPTGPTATPRAGPAAVENVQAVATGLEAPWAVDLAPDGRLFVTERPGRVRIVQLGPGGGLRSEPWATLAVSAQAGAERGLLGIAVDPDFARNEIGRASCRERV